jgi:hypothetical protein
VTQLDRKLRRLDRYPGAQQFIEQDEQNVKESLATETAANKSPNEQSPHQSNVSMTFKMKQMSNSNTNSAQKSNSDNHRSSSNNQQNASMLDFIYDDVTQRMKNIEDFGAPLSQLDRVLLSILT